MSIVHEWVDDHEVWDTEQEAIEKIRDASRGPKPDKSLNDYDAEFDDILDAMSYRAEIDRLEMEKQIAALGDCHKYYPTLTCVNGFNMEQLTDITLKDCQNKCSNTQGCKGIEYFRASGSDVATDDYKENQCNLSDGLEPEGCDPEKWQMWLWKRGGEMKCKKWRTQSFENKEGRTTRRTTRRGRDDNDEEALANQRQNTRDSYLRPTTQDRRNRGSGNGDN